MARMVNELRMARATLGLTIREVARMAGVAKSTVQRLEDGFVGTTVPTLAAVMAAVGLDLVLNAYPGKTVRLRDSGQLELADQLRQLASAYWAPRIEVVAGDHGQSADLVFFGADEIQHQEIERRAADFQAQLRSALRKREYLAARTNRPVRLVLAFEDTRHNREALRPHAALIRAQLRADSRAVLKSLRLGQPLGSDGLLWVRRRGS